MRRAVHTAWRRLGEEVVVIDLAANMVYGLDDNGGRVWEALEEARTPAELAGVVGSDLPETDAEGAVVSFLSELAALGLVEVGEGEAATQPGSVRATPRIVWREPMQRFGGDCGLRPGQGTPCGGKPLWS